MESFIQSANQRTLEQEFTMNKTKLVIIGGVAAGASAAAKARRCNEDADIVMFEKGDDISYATCGLPYYLSGIIQKRDALLITSAQFFKERFNVDVRTRHEVVSIDRTRKRVTVRNLASGEQFDEIYDKLIVAAGASAVIPPISGADLPFVYTLKTLEDTDRIFAHLKDRPCETAVVVGGGLIGMEAVENLAYRKIKISVVEFLPQVLSFLDPEMAEMVRWHLNRKKVDCYLSEKVTSIEQKDGRKWVQTSGTLVSPWGPPGESWWTNTCRPVTPISMPAVTASKASIS
jgi:tRNA 2-thiouridine synthesizing protein A